MVSRIIAQSLTLCFLALTLQPTTVLAQNGDGGGVPAGAAEPTSAAAANAQGGSGAQGGSVNLSTGSTIAIAVVVSVVVLLGIASTILWYIAKKRQWKVRETIRKSARKVTETILSPLTPKSGTFSFSPRSASAARFGPAPGSSQGQFQSFPVSSEKSRTETTVREKTRGDRDLEKGMGGKPKPRLGVAIPGKDAKIEDPLKSSVWNRVFGKNY